MALLGNTQTSLSKYVFIAAKEDMVGTLSCHDIPAFFQHMLERADLTRDLHFITRTTIDTLDYSGISLNQGSKLVFAAAGSRKRELGSEVPAGLDLPRGFRDPVVFAPGILVIKGPKHQKKRDEQDAALDRLGNMLEKVNGIERFPMIIVADDAIFTAEDWDNFLWVTFTRSDPATDIYGVGSFTHAKHWGAKTALVIDARLKTYHAPALEPDLEVEKSVDALGAKGGPLYGII
jgi:4-hydroxy-3-polyprenylbenzoate decarboxylase